MLTEAVLSLTASVGWGISEFFAKLSSNRNGPATTLFAAQSVGLAVVTVAVLATGTGRWELGVVVPVMALGWFNITGFFTLYKALQKGKLTIVSPIVSTSPALTVLLAVFVLGEMLPPAAWVTIAAILTGMVVMAVRKDGLASGARIAPGVPWALWTFITLGLVTFLLKVVVTEAGPIFTIFLMRLGAVVALLPLVALGKIASPNFGEGRSAALPVAVGSLDTLGFILFNFAISLGSLTIATVLSGLYTVVALMMAWKFLGERIAMYQLGGMAIAVGGTVLLMSILPA